MCVRHLRLISTHWVRYSDFRSNTHNSRIICLKWHPKFLNLARGPRSSATQKEATGVAKASQNLLPISHDSHIVTPHIPAAHINGMMQKRRNSSALAMELRLFCINPLIYIIGYDCTYVPLVICYIRNLFVLHFIEGNF